MERKKEVQSTMIYNDREKSPHTFKYYVFIFIWNIKKITSDLIKYKTWLLQTRREKSLQSTWDGILALKTLEFLKWYSRNAALLEPVLLPTS